MRLSAGHRSELSGIEFNSLLRRFAVAPLPVPASWYAVPLRLIVGFGFVEHGYAKLSRGARSSAPTPTKRSS
jgi:hypothetical protein